MVSWPGSGEGSSAKCAERKSSEQLSRPPRGIERELWTANLQKKTIIAVWLGCNYSNVGVGGVFRGGFVVPLLEIHLLQTSLGHVGPELFLFGCTKGGVFYCRVGRTVGFFWSTSGCLFFEKGFSGP